MSLFMLRYGALGVLEEGSCAKRSLPQLPSTQDVYAYLNPRNADVNHLKSRILRKEQRTLRSVGQIRLKSRLCLFLASFAGKRLSASQSLTSLTWKRWMKLPPWHPVVNISARVLTIDRISKPKNPAYVSQGQALAQFTYCGSKSSNLASDRNLHILGR